ncbi:MAG: hypothetical protein SFU55_00210 [Methylophilus sp.]|nr:hypothetical protein [Methylophilus sp.]
MLKKWLSKRNTKSEDFSNFLGDAKLTKKQFLIEQCKKNNVSIYIDDTSETSAGVYAELRGVASEAELENRLNSKTALSQAKFANIIAILAFIISVFALLKSFY